MITVTREHLYEEIWTEPMTTVAKRYGVSSNYLARICERLHVPRPPRGYWQQLAVGKDVDREPLPEPDPGDETTWSRAESINEYAPRPAPPPVFTGLPEHKTTRRGERPKTHPLLVGVKEDFLDSKVSTYDDDGYLRPKRQTLPDIFVSKDSLSRALDAANRLYLALEDRGHWVREATGQRYHRPLFEHREGAPRREGHGSRNAVNARPTLLLIGGVAIGLVLFEIAEQVEVMYLDGKWVPVPRTKAFARLKETERPYTNHQHRPSGRLGVQAYSPYDDYAWEKSWHEPKAGDLTAMLETIATELEAAAPSIAQQVREAKRQAEEEHQRRLVEQRLHRRKELDELRAKAAASSREQLLGLIESWVSACHIENFFADLAGLQGELAEGERGALATASRQPEHCSEARMPFTIFVTGKLPTSISRRPRRLSGGALTISRFEQLARKSWRSHLARHGTIEHMVEHQFCAAELIAGFPLTDIKRALCWVGVMENRDDIKEVAKALSCPPAQAERVLEALETRGFVEKTARKRQWDTTDLGRRLVYEWKPPRRMQPVIDREVDDEATNQIFESLPCSILRVAPDDSKAFEEADLQIGVFIEYESPRIIELTLSQPDDYEHRDSNSTIDRELYLDVADAKKLLKALETAIEAGEKELARRAAPRGKRRRSPAGVRSKRANEQQAPAKATGGTKPENKPKPGVEGSRT